MKNAASFDGDASRSVPRSDDGVPTWAAILIVLSPALLTTLIVLCLAAVHASSEEQTIVVVSNRTGVGLVAGKRSVAAGTAIEMDESEFVSVPFRSGTRNEIWFGVPAVLPHAAPTKCPAMTCPKVVHVALDASGTFHVLDETHSARVYSYRAIRSMELDLR